MTLTLWFGLAEIGSMASYNPILFKLDHVEITNQVMFV